MCNPAIYEEAAAAVASLTEHGKTVSTAESCTGGMISSAITAVPGASSVFGLGVCSYSEEIKTHVLGVDADIIREQGVVSAGTVKAMALGVMKLSGSDYAVSVSGVAGPGGGTPENPVGTVWIGWADKNGAGAEKNSFTGSRGEIRESAVLRSLRILQSLIGAE